MISSILNLIDCSPGIPHPVELHIDFSQVKFKVSAFQVFFTVNVGKYNETAVCLIEGVHLIWSLFNKV